MSAPLLQVQNLSLSMDADDLLVKLNLCIQAGECWGILGRNGAGKTTLLHTLAGIRPYTQGQITLCGQDLPSWRARERAKIVGLLTQDASEGFEASVKEAALAGRHPYIERFGEAQAADHAAVQHALQSCGLHELAERRVQSLSGGERRRLGLATLLAQDPKLMLLDEPLNHLDMRWQWCILHQLGELARQGRALILSLHDPNMARQMCSHALLLHVDGTWQAGEAHSLLSAENLSRMYDLPLQEIASPRGGWLIPSLAMQKGVNVHLADTSRTALLSTHGD